MSYLIPFYLTKLISKIENFIDFLTRTDIQVCEILQLSNFEDQLWPTNKQMKTEASDVFFFNFIRKHEKTYPSVMEIVPRYFRISNLYCQVDSLLRLLYGPEALALSSYLQ